jgi:hypothetical protein
LLFAFPDLTGLGSIPSALFLEVIMKTASVKVTAPPVSAQASPRAKGKGERIKTPFFTLWDGLTFPLFETTNMERFWSWRCDELKLLDKAPRHDTVLDNKILSRLDEESLGLNSSTLNRVARELACSLESLENAVKCSRGRYRGEAKVKLEDRLVRHLEEAHSLFSVVDEMWAAKDRLRQPYLIRQQIFVNLLVDIMEILDRLVPLREKLVKEGLPASSMEHLDEQIAGFCRLRGILSRWRDNPSQKMAAKFDACHGDVAKLKQGLTDLQQEAKAECKKQGMRFYQR